MGHAIKTRSSLLDERSGCSELATRCIPGLRCIDASTQTV